MSEESVLNAVGLDRLKGSLRSDEGAPGRQQCLRHVLSSHVLGGEMDVDGVHPSNTWYAKKTTRGGRKNGRDW